MALFCPATVLLATWAAGDVARVSAQVSGERVAVVLHGPADEDGITRVPWPRPS